MYFLLLPLEQEEVENPKKKVIRHCHQTKPGDLDWAFLFFFSSSLLFYSFILFLFFFSFLFCFFDLISRTRVSYVCFSFMSHLLLNICL